MSPNREVHPRRWQLGVVLLAIAVGFGISAYLIRDLINSRTSDRNRADRQLCVYVRDHVVKPDRDTVLLGPKNAVPTLHALGFTDKQILRYLRAQYGGVPPVLLVKAGFSAQEARVLSHGTRDGVVVELERRPLPDCSQPLNLNG